MVDSLIIQSAIESLEDLNEVPGGKADTIHIVEYLHVICVLYGLVIEQGEVSLLQERVLTLS